MNILIFVLSPRYLRQESAQLQISSLSKEEYVAFLFQCNTFNKN